MSERESADQARDDAIGPAQDRTPASAEGQTGQSGPWDRDEALDVEPDDQLGVSADQLAADEAPDLQVDPAEDESRDVGPRQVLAATGDERVDAALEKLATVDGLPLAAQVTVFDDVHRLLQDALSDGGPGLGGPTGR